MSATEEKVQDWLYDRLSGKSREFICPNTKVFGWEADLVCLTTAGYAYEYEIKCSRSDLLRDVRKRRHKKLKRGVQYGPSRFWYVCSPRVDASVSDLPDYAGLMIITPTWKGVRVHRKAPRLHTKKMSRKKRRYLARGLQIRYWEHERGT